MDYFRYIFHHFPEFRIIVCKECKYAIPPEHFAGHLQKNHKNITPGTRQSLLEQLRSIPAVAQTKEDVVYPEPDSKPVPYIEIYHDGRMCTETDENGFICGYIRRGMVRNIQQHCREHHNWTNPNKKGRQPIAGTGEAVPQPWINGIHCQTLFKAAGWVKLVQIHEEEEHNIARQDADYQIIDKQLKETQKKKEEARRAALINANQEESPFEGNRWLQKTQWAKILDGRNREWLMQFIRPVDMETEGRLAKVCRSVRRVIQKAQRDSQVEVVGSVALEIINRKEFGGDDEYKSGRPMQVKQAPKTIQKYGDVWIAMMKYFWRVFKIQQMEEASSSDEDEQTGGGFEASSRVRVRARVEDSPNNNRETDEKKSGKIRPAFEWTIEQEDKFYIVLRITGDENLDFSDEGPDQGGKQESKEEKANLDNAVLAFLISILDHNTGDIARKNILVTALAILAIDGEQGWKNPLIFTPVLSAVVTIGRMLVLSHAARIREAEIERIRDEEGISLKKAQRKAEDHYQIVERMARRFMGLATTGSKPGPMNYVLIIRTYGLKIRYNTTAPGLVDWKQNTILYGKVQFSIPQLRSMVHGLVQETREEFCENLLFTEWSEAGRGRWWKRHGLPRIEWYMLADDQSEMKKHWNFFRDNRNKKYLEKGERWIMKKVVGTEELKRRVLTRSTTSTIDQFNVRFTPRQDQTIKYKEAIEAFHERLLVLIHVTSGQPARGTEIITTRYKNSESGAGRGIFIEDGMMVYVTGYHKGYGISASLKIVHRYMPREVGELLFYYMWLVQPFWEEMRQLGGDLSEDSPYLWHPAAIEEQEPDLDGIEEWEEYEREMQRQEEGEDVVAIEELEFELDADTSKEDRQSEAEYDEDIEVRDGKRAFRMREWTSQRVGRILVREFSNHIMAKITTLAWRHICIAIMRKYMKDGKVQRILTEENPGEVREEDEVGEMVDGIGELSMDDFIDEMAGHGQRMAAMIYARSNKEAFGFLHTRRAAFRSISQEWHKLLMFPSALQQEQIEQERGQGQVSMWRQMAAEEELHRWAWLKKVDLDQQLRRIIGPDAQFRGVQKEALTAIVDRKSPVIVIMGTGGGKSMLFMLPASCKGSNLDGITIVIVPLISLRADMMRRCNELGIECVEWSGRRPNEWASMVFITPEAATSEAFADFIRKQQAMGRLDRIVIDECHTILDTADGWRIRMRDLRELIHVETQMVYLTATLPPKDVQKFKAITGIETAGPGTAVWLRGSTTRMNIVYQVRKFEQQHTKEEELLQEIVGELLDKYEAPGKIVIYCEMVKQAEQYAEKLGGICYHRRVGTADEKRKIVEKLIRGEERVFTATNALGLGVDAPAIRAVIHVGRIRRLRDYAQESGRAGRDGKKSEAIILHGIQRDSSHNGREAEQEEVERMRQWAEADAIEFIQTKQCRRVVMDRVMDGNMQRGRCSQGEEKCDRCVALEVEYITQQERQQEQERQARRDIEQERASQRRLRQHGRTTSRQIEAVEIAERIRVRRHQNEEWEIDRDVRMEFERTTQQQRDWARREREQISIEEGEKVRMIEKLEKWKRGCVLCRIRGQTEVESQGHRLNTCRRRTAGELAAFIKQTERDIVEKKAWGWLTGCHGCGVPQVLCHSWKPKGGGERGWRLVGRARDWSRCQYRGVLVAAAVAMFGEVKEVREWVAKEMEEEHMEGGDPVIWMGRQQMVGGMESNKMMGLFMRFEQVVREEYYEDTGEREEHRYKEKNNEDDWSF